MCRHKKITILACVFLIALNIAACGQVKEDEIVNIEKSTVNQQENSTQTVEYTTNPETKENETTNEKESVTNQQESNVQEVEDTGLEATADELLDSFINGSIGAACSADLASTFYITDFNMDSEEWDSYSVGERVDLDNDGENELIINGPYGGIYLDARDNKVYEFAVADGTALILSYTYYNGAVWIMYSNRSSAGFEFYHMEKYEGADNLVAEMNFGEEFDINNEAAGIKYTWNETEISYDEYTELCSKIFAAEVNTNVQSIANNDDQIKKDDALENLPGEYEYLSDYGTGKLIIEKTSDGYDISDYESESSYRFLADSSNIESIENNRIYIKYPEQVFSDDTVIFCYYILEYSTDGINVYYGKSMSEEAGFLYHATKKNAGE